MGIKEEKDALRRKIKGQLKELTFKQKKEKSLAVAKLVSNLLSFLYNSSDFFPRSDVLGIYAPMSDEVDICCQPLMEGQVAFPDIANQQMVFKQCAHEDLLETSVFGVKLYTPPEKAVIVTPRVLLVPGLAFSKEGIRLGRGKGFYDRYLENFKGITVGVGFNEQIEVDVPKDNHDIQLQYVVTEEEVFRNV